MAEFYDSTLTLSTQALSSNEKKINRVLLNDEDYERKYPDSEIKVENNKMPSLSMHKVVEAAETPVQATATTAVSSAVVLAPNVGIFTVKLLQIFDLIDFFNIDFPENLKTFLQLFDNGAMEMVGNFILKIFINIFGDALGWINKEKIEVIEAKYGCNPHKKIQENEMGCLILSNGSFLIILIILIVLVKLIIIGLASLYRQISKNERKLFLYWT